MFEIFYFLVTETSYNQTEDYEEQPDDWSNYQPSMLRKPTSSPLRAFSDENIIIEVTDGNDETFINTLPTSQSHLTSQSQTPNGKMSSRRRPLLQEKQNVLVQSKLKSLEIANEQAGEEHAIKIRILLLQELQEKEKLEQEQLKTQMLRQQLEN